MEMTGQQGDANGQDCRQGKEQPMDRNAIGEVLQPPVHGPPGEGGGDDDGNEDQPDKIFRQQGSNTADGAAQDLADTDFFYSLLGGESRQPEEAQAGDEDGAAGEGAH